MKKNENQRNTTLRERLEDNLVWYSLALMVAGFLAGIGAYRGLLLITNQEVVIKGSYILRDELASSQGGIQRNDAVECRTKFDLLLSDKGDNSSVTVGLIEDIANCADARRAEYLKKFRQTIDMSLIEAEAVELALKAISTGEKLHDTHEKLFERWKIKMNYDQMASTKQLLFTILYLKRKDSESYKNTVDSIEKSLHKMQNHDIQGGNKKGGAVSP